MTADLPIVPTPRPVVRGDRMWVVVRDELDVPYVAQRPQPKPLFESGSHRSIEVRYDLSKYDLIQT